MNINIITRCTRVSNLKKVQESVFNVPKEINVTWNIIFDTNTLKDLDAELLESLQDDNTKFFFVKGSDNNMLYPEMSTILSKINDSWIYILDDDNLLHEDFYVEMYKRETEFLKNKSKIIVVSQKVDGKDFTGLDIRKACPENTKYQGIDVAQMLIYSDVFKQYTFGNGYAGDGIFVENVYMEHPEWFTWIDDVLSLYNEIEPTKMISGPKILYIGSTKPELKSLQFVDYESNELNVKYLKNDDNVFQEIINFKPNGIITSDGRWEDYIKLSNLPLNIRSKWMHLNGKNDAELGYIAYQSSMYSILNSTNIDDNKLISFFTPIYNTGNKLYNAYNSLLSQTYQYWEWVIVNDSSDGGKTLKIAEDIAKLDNRVKVYDFREKSNGNIGEVKYRACALARGYLLAELDHDDILTPNCAEDLYEASMKYSECGFFYTDSAEVDEDLNSLEYVDGFALGYGKYRNELYKGKKISVNEQPNINPKTIRHIVGVPNHVRAWRRNTYFEIGGHNRDLTVADDYELIIRTFLHTKICAIPKLGYIQFIYNNGNNRNTHDIVRTDIQRRVRTIMHHYNDAIKNRFTELGLEDWAYDTNRDNPLDVESRFGEHEQIANIIYKK